MGAPAAFFEVTSLDDLEAALQRAEELGGTRLVPPTDPPAGYGRFALFADPDGTPVGLRD